jgi:hypothetical protein
LALARTAWQIRTSLEVLRALTKVLLAVRKSTRPSSPTVGREQLL